MELREALSQLPRTAWDMAAADAAKPSRIYFEGNIIIFNCQERGQSESNKIRYD